METEYGLVMQSVALIQKVLSESNTLEVSYQDLKTEGLTGG